MFLCVRIFKNNIHYQYDTHKKLNKINIFIDNYQFINEFRCLIDQVIQMLYIMFEFYSNNFLTIK